MFDFLAALRAAPDFFAFSLLAGPPDCPLEEEGTSLGAGWSRWFDRPCLCRPRELVLDGEVEAVRWFGCAALEDEADAEADRRGLPPEAWPASCASAAWTSGCTSPPAAL